MVQPPQSSRREELNGLLVSLGGSGVHVYFQPPENIHLQYPAIIYERDFAGVQHADNQPYRITRRYSVTVIDRDVDSPILDKIERLPMCTFNRHFVADNLNHDVYSLYY